MCDQGELRLWKKNQKDVTSLALKVEEGSHQSRSGLQKLEKEKDKTTKKNQILRQSLQKEGQSYLHLDVSWDTHLGFLI